MEAKISFNNITKSFGENTVLHNIAFDVQPGEIHALLGENGAGKSTLLNVLHGIYSDYTGKVILEGKDVLFSSAQEAIDNGIAKVHQEISLVTELTVGQNIALGYEFKKGPFINFTQMYQRTDEILHMLGCNFSSRTIVSELSVGEMQMVQIAKALFNQAKIISFDEPTASLSDREVESLLKLIVKLKGVGITSLYVTHRLDEVFKICDRATILRDGRYVGTFDINKTTKADVIRNMVGRDVTAFAKREHPACYSDEVVLEIKNLSKNGVYDDISFDLKKGELLGVSGLVGSKRTDMVRGIFGADPISSGKIILNGEEISIRTPAAAYNKNIALIPEDRKYQGYVSGTTNAENISLASLSNVTNKGFVDHKRMDEVCKEYLELLDIRPFEPGYLTEQLSGGNAQKVVMAKALASKAQVFIFDEPTKGVDVGAKAEIYKLMEDLLLQGCSIIMVSSELPEVIGMSDRVVVMREGKMTALLDRSELSEETIMHYAMEG